MVLYLIGIGLNDEKDITLKGLEKIRESDFVFLENYTSKLNCSVEDLEKLYKKKIILADRELVEKRSDEILEKAKNKKVSFLVVGDIFGATTHTDLLLRAKEKKISVEFVHNASVINAIGITGLELYKFGRIASIPFPEKSFEPETPYDIIKENKKLGMHTLVLLDLKPQEKGFMTVNEGIKILLEIEKKRRENVFTENKFMLGCARIGGNFKIKYGRASDILKEDFGKPLHCIVIPGKLHFIEEEALEIWK